MSANICTNIIHVSYYGKNEEENIKISKEIRSLLYSKFSEVTTEFDENGVICDFSFESNWAAPIILLDEISEKYKVDIIGVAYEFDDGYVESFELFADLNEEIPGAILETITDDNIQEGVDTIVLPENELEILNDVLEDDIVVSDKEIFDWKEKELEDWQKRVIEERKELSEKIEKLKEFINTNPDNNSIPILYEQLDAMIDYRFTLDFRINQFNGK